VSSACAAPIPITPDLSPSPGTATKPAVLLLVQDDATLAEMLRDRLTSRGHTVWHAVSGAEAEAIGEQVEPDLVIVDVALPDTNGLVLCANLRERWQVPIIISTASERPEDALLAFKLGADDFVRKPFSTDELEARIEAALRRPTLAPQAAPPAKGATTEVVGPLAIDRSRCRVTLGDQPVHLTPTEFRLLCALADPPNHVHTAEDLAQRVWGTHDAGIGQSLQVHIRRMRARLKAGPVQPPSIVAVRGFGYRLVWEDDPPLAAVSSA
jgi:DNA-binding response OmpR family regulator